MIQRYIVSKEDPQTGEWIQLCKFGSFKKAEAYCNKLESQPPYRKGSDNRLYLCIELG